MSYMSPFLILFWVWVTDHRRNRLYIGQLFNSMNDQDLFSAQKCDSLPHTLLLFVWLLTFNVPTPKSKTATELEHAHTLSSYWDGFFFCHKKRPQLSQGIEPATFRYNGQRANHYITLPHVNISPYKNLLLCEMAKDAPRYFLRLIFTSADFFP